MHFNQRAPVGRELAQRRRLRPSRGDQRLAAAVAVARQSLPGESLGDDAKPPPPTPPPPAGEGRQPTAAGSGWPYC